MDDVAKLEDRLVHVSDVHRTVADDPSTETATERLFSAPYLARLAYYSCSRELAQPTGDFQRRTIFRTDLESDGAGEAPDFLADPYYPLVEAEGTCASHVAAAHLALCVADHLAEIAAGVSQYQTRGGGLYETDGTHFYRVAPQSSRANAWILEVAVEWAKFSGVIASENLRSSTNRYTEFGGDPGGFISGSCENAELQQVIQNVPASSGITFDEVTYGETLAMVFAQATDRVREIGRSAASAHEALADAALSTTTSVTGGARAAWVDPFFSRARGAHVLVGGILSSGLDGFGHGFCPSQIADDRTLTAVAVVRESGVDPALLASGRSAAEIRESVASALRGYWDYDEQQFPDESITSARGLSDVDYLNAAKFLTEQFDAFHVNRRVLLGDNRFAGVVNAPTRADLPSYFHLARLERASVQLPNSGGAPVFPANFFSWEMNGYTHADGTSAGVWSAGANDRPAMAASVLANALAVPPSSDYGIKSVAAYLDYAASSASDLLRAPDDAMPSDVSSVLGTIVGSLLSERQGRVETCRSSVETPALRLRLFGQPGDFVGAADGAPVPYLVVQGIDGVRCATTGSIHGSLLCGPVVERVMAGPNS